MLTVQQLAAIFLLVLLNGINNARCYQFKVGDLDAWGPPPPSDPQIYASWSLARNFSIGDSLLFLYPPSQDSVIQVTERSFNSCSISDPIAAMHDGDSVFNITAPGYFYFTSGVSGRCEKKQKLAVAVPSANGTFFPPPAESPAMPPSFPNVFGPSAAQVSGTPRLAPSTAAAIGTVLGGAAIFWIF